MITPAHANYMNFLLNKYVDGLEDIRERIRANKAVSLDEDELETIYAWGYNFFQLGNYPAALELFQFLVNECPTSNVYWRGLGAINQQMQHYSTAVKAYTRAIDLDASDIVSYLYRSESQILMGDPSAACSTLEWLSNRTDVSLEKFQWVHRARLLLDVLAREDPTGDGSEQRGS